MIFKILPLFLLAAAGDLTRPVVDFDLVIDTVKSSGQWEELGKERFAFRPSSTNTHWQPLREGHWLYTDYGWTWEGRNPGSWATDHYGYWTKKQTAGWVWIPDGQWLPASVEWLKSGNYVGWRPSRLDRFSNLLESEAERHGDPSEWNFVPIEKMTGPLHLEDFADEATTEKLLKNAEPVDHVFVTYREIPRPGPSVDILKSNGKTPPIPVVRELQEIDQTQEDSSSGNHYVYRPTFHQDNDGIMRRVQLFLNPRIKKENENSIKETVGDRPSEEKKKAELRKIEDNLKKEREHMDSLYR